MVQEAAWLEEVDFLQYLPTSAPICGVPAEILILGALSKMVQSQLKLLYLYFMAVLHPVLQTWFLPCPPS